MTRNLRLLLLALPLAAQTYRIDTVAGGGPPLGVQALQIQVGGECAIVDTVGNLYVCSQNQVLVFDPQGLLVRKIGTGVSGFSGDGGPASAATLSHPQAVALDAAGNLFIADYFNNRIRQVAAGSNIITTFAGNGQMGFSGDGGPAVAASLSYPIGVKLDSAGNLYVADSLNHRVRKITPSGIISTVAGNGGVGYTGDNGPATAANITSPDSVALDASGNLFIADAGNSVVRKVAANTGIITTVAGTGVSGVSGDNGLATAATFDGITGVALDAAANLYIATGGRIRKVTAATGIVTTVAGAGNSTADGIPATSALLSPYSVFVDGVGNYWIAEPGHYRVRKVDAATFLVNTVAGGGPGGDGGQATAATLAAQSVGLDVSNNLFVGDWLTHRVRKVTSGTNVINNFAGNGIAHSTGDGGLATAASLYFPSGVAADASGNVYIADQSASSIRKVAGATGIITTIAGTGIGGFSGDGGPSTAAALRFPRSVAVDTLGNLYIADTYNHRIRKVSIATGVITTVAGNGTAAFAGDNGPATAASLNTPGGVAVDPNGNLYIADSFNNRVRKVTAATGVITTVAGTGGAGFSGDGGPATSATMFGTEGVALDSSGNLYIADLYNYRIRKVIAATGNIFTIAGGGKGGDNVPATAAVLDTPYSLAVDTLGGVFVASGDRVRKLTPVSVSTCLLAFANQSLYFAATGSSGSVNIVDPNGCAYTVVSDSPWLTLTSPATGATSSTLNFSVAADTSVSRTGYLRLYDSNNNLQSTLLVLQSGSVASTITLERTSLNFGVRPGQTSPAQTVALRAAAGVAWTVTSSSNVQVSPASGTGPGTLSITATAGSNGSVVVSALDTRSQTVAINVRNLPAAGTGANPSATFGFIDQPSASQTTGYAGAIAVTGWALDDVGVAKVSVYREPVSQDAGPSINTVLGKQLVYIGDSIFLPDTRPDVASANPANPQNYRAGWGMLFLTNTTLNNNGVAGSGGNGTYILHIIATSVEGYQYELGTRTVTVDNVHATLPFGTIDTPAQGQQNLTGTQFVNFGWALTNQPNVIPFNGSTMFVVIDGAKAGVPAYGFPRSDIDGLFPGYQNTGKSIGYFYIDMTRLTSGIHSIAWSVKDNAGNLQGIGSRVFYVNNPGGPVPAPTKLKSVQAVRTRKPSYRIGPDLEAPLRPWQNETIVLSPGERLELHTARELSDDPSLPPCSTIEGKTFYWQPPIMALGDFPVSLKTSDGGTIQVNIRIALP